MRAVPVIRGSAAALGRIGKAVFVVTCFSGEVTLIAPLCACFGTVA